MPRKRIRNALLALAASLVTLEVVLQILALGVWWLRPPLRSAPASAGETVVLCVGDSFTHGIGATRDDGNYPAQMELRLREQSPGRVWRVVNAGRAGQGSWDVLRRLDRQIADVRPQILCVLVGVNDRWARPELHRLPDAPQLERDSFRLELRTLRLGKLVRGFAVTMWERAFPPAGPAADPRAAGAAAYGAGRFAEAAACWEQELAHAPEDEVLRCALCDAWARCGERDRAERQLEWLRTRQRARPSQAAAESLALALEHLGRNHAALAQAQELSGRYPASTILPAIITRQQTLVGDGKAARSAQDHQVELAAGAPDRVRASRLWERASTVLSEDPLQSLQDLVQSYGLDPQRERTLAVLRIVGRTYSRPMLEQCLLLVGDVPATRAQELRALLVEAQGAGTGPEATLPEPGPDGLWLFGRLRLEVGQDEIAWGGVRLPARFALQRATGRLPTGQDFDLIYEHKLDTLYLSVSNGPQRAPLARWQYPRSPDAHGPAPAAAVAPELTTILEDHLRQIVARARAAGVTVVMGSYPYEVPEINASLLRVARATGCAAVEVLPKFKDLLRTRRLEDLYFYDHAHCSDEGYGVMARLMAAGVLQAAGTLPPR